jgi:hypothetical protein
MTVSDQLEPKAFELVSYMITSAANLLHENRLYAPYRLVDAASRLITMLDEEGVHSDRLHALRAQIDEGKFSVMTDEQLFADFLQDLVLALVPLME